MSRGNRIPTLLLVLGTILTATSVGAEDKPGTPSPESRAAGRWTDPPAKADIPAMNAAAVKPETRPAKADGSRNAARAEARPVRRNAKVRRERIRTAAGRARPATVERSLRVEKRASRPVAARTMPPPAMRAAGRSLRPVYGPIPPDAPAEAYYEQRRFGTAGNRPGDLGLTPGGGRAYRTVGMRGDGHLVMRWHGPRVPAGLVVGHPPPFE